MHAQAWKVEKREEQGLWWLAEDGSWWLITDIDNNYACIVRGPDNSWTELGTNADEAAHLVSFDFALCKEKLAELKAKACERQPPSEGDDAAYNRYKAVVAEQGWDAAAMIDYLELFIGGEPGLPAKLADYAERVAAAENGPDEEA